MTDAAERMKARLRADLKSAMTARERARVAVLRALIGTLDNAQAVPLGEAHARYQVFEFGDRAAEVPRLVLSASDVQALFAAEAESRRAAADQLRTHGQAARADALEAEAALVEAYFA